MKIDEQTIRSLLADAQITKGVIRHDNGSIGLGLLIERLTAGINHVIETATQVRFINEELSGLKEKYDENLAEMGIQLSSLVKACKHPSWTEKDRVVVCNICGGVEEEMF